MRRLLSQEDWLNMMILNIIYIYNLIFFNLNFKYLSDYLLKTGYFTVRPVGLVIKREDISSISVLVCLSLRCHIAACLGRLL